jgi:predicted ATPase
MKDPLEKVAGGIAEESILLCIDEFMVTDVADALILNRLFDHLFRNGIVMVSTSNRAPDKLYEGGLQRDLFLPFIAKLKERCVVHQIGSATDYRRLTAAETGFYFMGHGASETLLKLFIAELDGEEAKPTTVEVIMGRKLKVPLAGAGCAFFQFHELCEMPLGAADFFGLFKNFHTLALDNVPVFGAHNRSAAYRFVTLVDVIYEHRARFMCSAEGIPKELFDKIVTRADAPLKTATRINHFEDADLLVDDELGFAKDRTMSRLTEMHSKEYLKEHAEAHACKDYPFFAVLEVL